MKVEQGTVTVERTLDGAKIAFLTKDYSEVDELLNKSQKTALTLVVASEKRKRSLDANSYYYALLGKLQKAINVSAIEAHNMMLNRYGTLYETDRYILLPEEVNYLKEEGHYRPIPNKIIEKNGQRWQAYWVIKPSHEYSTSEFSALIDGLISECRELGIETLPTQEIERLKALWKEKSGKK